MTLINKESDLNGEFADGKKPSTAQNRQAAQSLPAEAWILTRFAYKPGLHASRRG